MSRSFVVVFALILTLAGCSSSPAEPTEPIAATLAPGESYTAGSLKLTFVRITADSRCPGDAICITAGDAQAAIEIQSLGSRQATEIFLVDADKRTLTAGNYRITFETLTPYPFVSLGPIAPSAYRATFEIRRL